MHTNYLRLFAGLFLSVWLSGLRTVTFRCAGQSTHEHGSIFQLTKGNLTEQLCVDGAVANISAT